jgi:hypothetical protein
MLTGLAKADFLALIFGAAGFVAGSVVDLPLRVGSEERGIVWLVSWLWAILGADPQG